MTERPDVEVIVIMIAKADDKLHTAGDLFKLGHYDDAVSRAYYAVFHALSAVLLSRGRHFSSHGQVIGSSIKNS